MKSLIKKIFSFTSKEPLYNLKKETTNLNIAIESKGRAIDKFTKDLIKLKKAHKLLSSLFCTTTEIYIANNSIEDYIQYLEIIIKIESLHKKMLEQENRYL